MDIEFDSYEWVIIRSGLFLHFKDLPNGLYKDKMNELIDKVNQKMIELRAKARPEQFGLNHASGNRVGYEYNNFNIICEEPQNNKFLKVGKDTWIGYFCILDATGGLEIGEHCSIASGVHIYTHDAVRWATQNLEKDHKNWSHVDRAPVKIGNNVFIGANSVILKGVTIGDKAIIGAGTIVNKDVPEGKTAVGNPMRLIE